MAEEAQQIIEQASQAVQSARYDDALALLDRALPLDPNNAEIFVLRGVALSRLGRADEATAAFENAIALAPHSARSYYNFAVHLYLIDKPRALEMAREAVRLQGDHGSAADLVARLERETGALHEAPPVATAFSGPAPPVETAGAPPVIPEGAFAQPPTAGYYRGAFQEYEQPIHSLKFVENFGKGWDIVGWVLTAAEAAGFVYSLFIIPAAWRQIMEQMNLSNPFANGQFMFGNPIESILMMMVHALMLLWIILDISDRRSNWTWLVPFILACCCGTHWIVLGIYILFGRPTK